MPKHDTTDKETAEKLGLTKDELDRAKQLAGEMALLRTRHTDAAPSSFVKLALAVCGVFPPTNVPIDGESITLLFLPDGQVGAIFHLKDEA